MGITERREREKQKRRKAILNAAEKIFFVTHGDTGTMDDVAAKVELSKGTLYLYYKNKADLLYALAEKGVQILEKQLQGAADPAKTGKEQLSDIGDEFVKFVEEYPKHFELILRFELTDPPPVEEGQEGLLMEPALQLLRAAIILGQQDGSVRNDFNESELVLILWSQMLGVLQNLLHKEGYLQRYGADLSRVIKGHYRIIMKGITAA